MQRDRAQTHQLPSVFAYLIRAILLDARFRGHDNTSSCLEVSGFPRLKGH